MSNGIRGVENNVNELSEARLWKSLDSISERLTGIESQLSEVVRLEERVNNHDKALSRYGRRLDNHDDRLRESEIWQANVGDRTSIERSVANIQENVKTMKIQINDEVDSLQKKISELEANKNIDKGHKDVGKEVLKWTAGILAAILIFMLKKG